MQKEDSYPYTLARWAAAFERPVSQRPLAKQRRAQHDLISRSDKEVVVAEKARMALLRNLGYLGLALYATDKLAAGAHPMISVGEIRREMHLSGEDKLAGYQW